MTAFNKPFILGDNFFDDVVLHPSHTVTQTGTEVDGSEVFSIADNLRDLTHYSPSETNTAISIRVDCFSVKQGSCIILDRGHNLLTKVVTLLGSNNNFSSSTTVFTATIPASAGGLPTDANGCITREGVWVKTFTPASFASWKLTISAMGAGLSPLVTGLYLGDLYRFPDYLMSPGAYDYRIKNQVLKNAMSERGVRVKRRIINFAELDIKMQMEEADFLLFHAQVANLLFYNHPWWFCLDDSTYVSAAELTRLFQLPGDVTYDPVCDPVHRKVAFLLEEVAPLITL